MRNKPFEFWIWGKRSASPPKPRKYKVKGKFSDRMLRGLAIMNILNGKVPKALNESSSNSQ